MLRNITLFILLACGAALAQPSTSSGVVYKQNFNYGYQASPDHSRIAYYDFTLDNKCQFSILNLRDFSVQRIPALCGATLMPDLSGQYLVSDNNGQNRDTTKANFKLYYSSDGTSEKMKVFPGQHYPFGPLPNGKILAGDVSVWQFQNLNTVRNLHLFDPVSGTAGKMLRAGSQLRASEGMVSPAYPYGRPLNWLFSPAALVASTKEAPCRVKVLPLNGKPMREFLGPPYVVFHSLTDTLLRGGSFSSQSAIGQLVLCGMSNGAVVLDTVFRGGPLGRYALVQDGHVWSLEPKTNNVLQYAIKARKLQLIKTYPLQGEGVSLPDILYHNMIISKQADRVAVLPIYNPSGGQRDNKGYIWEMSSGKLLHVISPFYSKSSDVAAPEPVAAAVDPCAKEKAALSIKLGSWVREGKSGPMIQLVDYDCRNQRYTGSLRIQGSKKLENTTMAVELFQLTIAPIKYRVVQARTCRRCEGYGTLSGTREYRSVDYGIYNKYTKTGTVSYTELCPVCKGDGVIE